LLGSKDCLSAKGWQNMPRVYEITPALATLFFTMSAAAAAAETNSAIFQAGNRILFQGDSITDGARGRNNDPNHVLGHSYAFLIAAKYGALHPERNLTFFNRGISGNKVPDLLGRWQKDAIDLKPTVVSILIGVNDIWHPLLSTNQVVSVEQYEAGYDKLLAETVAALPDAKSSYSNRSLPPGAPLPQMERLAGAHLKKFQAVVAKLGAKYHAPVVKLQSVFDEAASALPPSIGSGTGCIPLTPATN
jgi:lysophospholipase L1-like esterase